MKASACFQTQVLVPGRGIGKKATSYANQAKEAQVERAAPFYTQPSPIPGGSAEIKIEVEEASLPDSSLLVQANFAGRTATRKFVLRRVE